MTLDISIRIFCDYKNGKCDQVIDGFQPDTSNEFIENYIKGKNWRTNGEKHYCPEHSKVG